jgi:hypothetical protein
MLAWGQAAIVGHIDHQDVEQRPRYFREDAPWYREEIEQTLGPVSGRVIVELNTSWRHTGASIPARVLAGASIWRSRSS